MSKIVNRQSLAFSESNQISQAIPRFHVERINERYKNERQSFRCFGGDMFANKR